MRVVCALCLSLILILSEFFRSLGFPAFCVCFYEVCNVPSSYRQPGGRGQLLSRRYCTHSVWLFSCALVRPNRPTALWRFRVSTSNSLSGRSWLHAHTHLRHIIILTLNKIFEYVEMTIFSRPRGSPESQGAFASSRKYLSISR